MREEPSYDLWDEIAARNAEKKPPMSQTRVVERFEDMSPLGRLRLLLQPDGDVIVAIIPDPDARGLERGSVEFCSVGAGGGRSPKTLRALRALAEAIEEDNREMPIRRDRHETGPAAFGNPAK